jgi:hypothetical protein
VVVDALESGFLFFATGADRGFPVLEGLKGATLECEGMFTRGPALLIIPADGEAWSRSYSNRLISSTNMAASNGTNNGNTFIHGKRVALFGV